MPPLDFTDQARLADFDRLVGRVRRWVEVAPDWAAMDRTRALWKRIAPRVETLRVDLERVLVVGVVGGTGTGKSTLLNALVGEQVCLAGDVERPTTRRPVVLAHPDADISFLQLDDVPVEVHRRAVPLLEHAILVDCPDPDTQSRDGGPGPDWNQNLDVLRRVLPHCDVLLCTGTAQKYKTHAVVDELLRHAPGRQVVFVQTHASVDPDITPDWQEYLESQGFEVQRMFYLDGQEACVRAEQQLPPPAEFSRLLDFLSQQLAGRAGQRIVRANALDLLDWFLGEARQDLEAAAPKLEKLQQALGAEQARLFGTVRARLAERLRDNRGIWRARLLREVTQRWGWGPFAAFLRLLGSARSLLRFAPALRARGLAPMVVAGGIGVGQSIAERVRQSWAEGNWLAAADLGITPGEAAQSHSILTGFARDAGLELPAGSSTAAVDADALAAAAQRVYREVETAIDDAIEQRARRRAGGVFHALLEILFLILPAALLWRLGKNFFYEHLWLEQSTPLYGIDFLIQAALWVVVWGLLLRGLLTWRLQRGLSRDIAGIVERLTPEVALGPMFEGLGSAAAAARQHAAALPALQEELNSMRRELEATDAWQLGRLQTGRMLPAVAHEHG